MDQDEMSNLYRGPAQAPGVIPHPLPEVNFLMDEIPTPKPYIFMIRVTRQIKCLIAQAPGVIPHPGSHPLKSSLQVGGGV
jgi:hypothetical protein